MIHYRPATNADSTHLRDLDLKCHEQPPSPMGWWRETSENPQAKCLVACKSHVPIGMAVWERQAFKLPENNGKVTTQHFHKICVRSEFRRQGIAKRMLAHAHEEARQAGCPYMSMTVPEYRCDPNSPDDVSEWLKKLEFKATMILPFKVKMYGLEYDQYLFVFKVKV